MPAARCTVERLMRKDALEGVRRARKRRTTIPDDRGQRPRDLVDRDFTAEAPNRLWVSDFTYVMTWSGVVYVAFVIDAFSRRIVGWKADASMRTELVLDTLEMALWSRDRDGIPRADGMISHSDAGSQPGLIRSLQHRVLGWCTVAMDFGSRGGLQIAWLASWRLARRAGRSGANHARGSRAPPGRGLVDVGVVVSRARLRWQGARRALRRASSSRASCGAGR
jgi:hypothetical protein